MDFNFNRTVWLIDSENVNDNWVSAVADAGQRDQIVIFYTDNSANMSVESVGQLAAVNRQMVWKKCYTGTNALDFQLVSELGSMIAKRPKDNYAIVANDTGYDAVVKYWSNNGVKISRVCVENGSVKKSHRHRAGKKLKAKTIKRLEIKNTVSEDKLLEDHKRKPAEEKTESKSNQLQKPEKKAESMTPSAQKNEQVNAKPDASLQKKENKTEDRDLLQKESQNKSDIQKQSAKKEHAKKKHDEKQADTEKEHNKKQKANKTKSEKTDPKDALKDDSEKKHKKNKKEKHKQEVEKSPSEKNSDKKKEKKAEKKADKARRAARSPEKSSNRRPAKEQTAPAKKQPLAYDEAIFDSHREFMDALTISLSTAHMDDFHRTLIHVCGEPVGSMLYRRIIHDNSFKEEGARRYSNDRSHRIDNFIEAVLKESGYSTKDRGAIRALLAQGSADNYAALFDDFVATFGDEMGRKYYSLFKTFMNLVQEM